MLERRSGRATASAAVPSSCDQRSLGPAALLAILTRGGAGVSPKEIIQELFSAGRLRRYNAGDETAIDELVADDMINHAAGPLRQGREGWKQIIATISNDLGPFEIENHRFIADGDLVAHHMTMRGIHQASTMPLLAGVSVTLKPVAWTYIHIWRVAEGKVVEHWACRDDIGLLAQVGAWPAR